MRPETTGSSCSPVGSPRWSWQELVDAAALSSADVVEMDTSMAMPAATSALGAARAAWHEKMPTAFAPMPSAVPLLPDAGEAGASEAAEPDVHVHVFTRGAPTAQQVTELTRAERRAARQQRREEMLQELDAQVEWIESAEGGGAAMLAAMAQSGERRGRARLNAPLVTGGTAPAGSECERRSRGEA